ncbi:MAG: hypothetical protein DHS20C03_32940 [Minwuia thermotolerans]|nr:MAG: hypothetical protein DHS20C03_32940 [Minwuia thermotolerans]
MTNIRAREAGEALQAIATKLNSAKVLEPDGFNTLMRVSRDLKAGKRKQTWPIEVDDGAPVRFRVTSTSDGKQVRPVIHFAEIGVNQSIQNRPPFDRFDLAIIIEGEDRKPLSRWHIDLANASGGVIQPGPLFHLQFGGRIRTHGRDEDHPVKEPRWCHPPMELALASEMIVANFFETEWATLREDRGWCSNINLFQKLCYENYLERLKRCLDGPSSTTILRDVWASNWN